MEEWCVADPCDDVGEWCVADPCDDEGEWCAADPCDDVGEWCVADPCDDEEGDGVDLEFCCCCALSSFCNRVYSCRMLK